MRFNVTVRNKGIYSYLTTQRFDILGSSRGRTLEEKHQPHGACLQQKLPQDSGLNLLLKIHQQGISQWEEHKMLAISKTPSFREV